MFSDIIKIIKHFFGFIKDRKLWYLLPMFFAFFLVLLLIVIAETTPVGPFIYTIF